MGLEVHMAIFHTFNPVPLFKFFAPFLSGLGQCDGVWGLNKHARNQLNIAVSGENELFTVELHKGTCSKENATQLVDALLLRKTIGCWHG